MIADYLVDLEKRVEAMEKEIAELKVQVSERQKISVEEVVGQISKLLERSSISQSAENLVHST
ncbi:hypothetical protein [Desulfosporosinus sp. OT]|uniref:hypothetical protein n=1 Tax=Desulfosporosinus sp. OT TaxID=913865 RepID=UPI0002239F88|nr:hypothetical protein [Desulfosporosinus sp. OT]EGW40687.1 hypothetical protein DOT_1310 [Desulfosporosinus sp. OT]